MGIYDPKYKKSNFGNVVKIIGYGIFIFALAATLKVLCEPIPKPPTPPLM